MPSRSILSNTLNLPRVFKVTNTLICTTVIMDPASKKEEQRRIRERARRAAETAEEKELRLSKRRVRDKARRAERTAQQREEALQQLRRQQQERCADETSEQREDRLQLMRDQQRTRRAAESDEQREDRLQLMRDQEHERRAAEDLSLRNGRLQRLRESRERREDRSQVSLLDQPAVRAKVLKFHQSLIKIEEPLCLTCLESFPGLTVSSDECTRCRRDDSTPKLYCDANNMNPGEVPPQLQVITVVTFFKLIMIPSHCYCRV